MIRKVNLIPMAGTGKRFMNVGYEVPKPLIDINGRPMFVIHGTGDERVGVHHSQMMIERAEKEGVNMTSWIIPDLEHVEAPLSHSEEYEDRIIEFYEGALT